MSYIQILTFLLGEDKFALDIKLVDTIEYKMPVTYVPKAKNYVKGLINIRGKVLPVIDINMIIGNKNKQIEVKKFIIANVDNESLALAVSDIEDVLQIEESDVEIICFDKDTPVIKYDDSVMILVTYDDLKNI